MSAIGSSGAYRVDRALKRLAPCGDKHRICGLQECPAKERGVKYIKAEAAEDLLADTDMAKTEPIIAAYTGNDLAVASGRAVCP